MKDAITQDTDYFDGVDLDVPSIKHPLIEKLQANAKMMISDNQLLDDDVLDWLSKQDNETKNRVNIMLRQVMALHPA